MKNLTIDAERLWDDLMATAKIGATPKGGICRLTLTELDAPSARLVQGASADTGLHRHDRRHGHDVRPPCRPARRYSAHRHGQPSRHPADRRQVRRRARRAGRARSFARACIAPATKPSRPIEVVNWTNEEGARFAPPMIASGVFAGVYSRDWACARTDRSGETFGEALDKIGYRGPQKPAATTNYRPFSRFTSSKAPISKPRARTSAW